MKMADKKATVLAWLRQQPYEWASPTEIGKGCLGLDYCNASSRTSPVCKALVEDGLLERNERGHYRLRGAA